MQKNNIMLIGSIVTTLGKIKWSYFLNKHCYNGTLIKAQGTEDFLSVTSIPVYWPFMKTLHC